MLAGVYMLQTNKVRFNQYKVEDTCPLCRLEPEDISHMLLCCPALADVREAPLSDIRGLVTREYGSHLWSSWSRSTLVAVLIDSHNLKARVPEGADMLSCCSWRLWVVGTVISCTQKDCNYTGNCWIEKCLKFSPICGRHHTSVHSSSVNSIILWIPWIIIYNILPVIDLGAPFYWRELRQTKRNKSLSSRV